jgi:hypothetical protein
MPQGPWSEACPIEGGVRVRIEIFGEAAVTSVRVGGAEFLNLGLGARARATLQTAAVGAIDLVATATRSRFVRSPAVRYVADLLAEARAVVAGHEIVTIELIDATPRPARAVSTAPSPPEPPVSTTVGSGVCM